jgi:hypothetical protein
LGKCRGDVVHGRFVIRIRDLKDHCSKYVTKVYCIKDAIIDKEMDIYVSGNRYMIRHCTNGNNGFGIARTIRG